MTETADAEAIREVLEAVNRLTEASVWHGKLGGDTKFADERMRAEYAYVRTAALRLLAQGRREGAVESEAMLRELYEAELQMKRATQHYNDAAYNEEDGGWLLGRDNPCFQECAIAEGVVNAAISKTQRTLEARAALSATEEEQG